MKYTIVDGFQPNWKKEFNSKKSVRAWILDGMFSCEGAERDHYVEMLAELEYGKKVLHYN